MEFFFNELSIHDQFHSKEDFKAAIKQFREYRETIKNAGFIMYIHRGILERPVLGNNFRKEIQACFDQQQVRTLMNWFNKAGSFLPDESYADVTDRFICHHPVNLGGGSTDITDSAMAECAFRCIVDEEASSISLKQSEFAWSPIQVSLEGSDTGTTFENFYSPPSLTNRVVRLRPAVSSWDMLLNRIDQLSGVTVEPYVLKRLRVNAFAQNVAEGLYVCAEALSEMATASSLDQFNELFTKYATGRKARFSDSSTSEKDDFEGALSFEVDGEQRICPYHGKVKIQQYRIHLVDRPSYGNSIRIVYIGPKLTKK